ncbi:hypothetical protein [Sulfitobacter sp.]|uniref:hypothetical protein n=1 Tax=Sulfitobacter sp. TaxID=1903071 RepID=UPI00300175DA
MTAISEFIKPAHKAVARSIGYALTTGDSEGWGMFTAIVLLRLDDAERIRMTYATLQSLHPDHVEDTREAALCRSGAGIPQAPLFNRMDQAVFWADMAEADELDAYCLAAFNRMAPQRQSAFLHFVRERAAA